MSMTRRDFTKAGPGAGPKVDREGREASDGRMEASFDKLRADTVDLMQVHNFRGWEEAIPLMREWKEEGRLRYVGITIPGMTEVRHVADNMAAARGRLPDASLRKRQEAFFDAL